MTLSDSNAIDKSYHGEAGGGPINNRPAGSQPAPRQASVHGRGNDHADADGRPGPPAPAKMPTATLRSSPSPSHNFRGVAFSKIAAATVNTAIPSEAKMTAFSRGCSVSMHPPEYQDLSKHTKKRANCR